MVRFAIASVVIVVALFGLSRPTHGSPILLLDFTSPQCGPCQTMAPTIESLKTAGYPIRPIDVTRDADTTKQYKVARVPMLVMLVDGEEFERVQGGMSGTQLEAMFERANSEVARRKRVRAQSPDPRAAVQPALTNNTATPPSVAWPNAQLPAAPQSDDNQVANVQLVQQRTAASDSQYGRRVPTVAVSANARPSAEGASLVDPKLAALVGSSVRLRVEDSAGHAFGTGTIIDARQGEALVITCGHLFRQSKGTGPLSVELFEATPSGARSVGQVPGLVISYDLERDVALVAIRPGRPVAIVPVAPPRTVIERGDRVASVGCSNGQDPSVLASRVTSIDRYQGPPNIETSGAPVEGRSGGGLFNEQGQLIGVCFAADHEGNEGLYAALKVIHDELNAHGLSEIYSKPSRNNPNTDILAAGRAPAPGPVVRGPVVRGQEPGDMSMPAPRREPAMPADLFSGPVAVNATNATPAPAALTNPVEQAAWDEIMNRAATSEVICIIRPKQPGGQSEVITLDGMSPEFVRALASLRKEPANLTR